MKNLTIYVALYTVVAGEGNQFIGIFHLTITQRAPTYMAKQT